MYQEWFKEYVRKLKEVYFMINKTVNIDDVCRYGYYDEAGQKVLVLDEEKLKKLLDVKEIRLE